MMRYRDNTATKKRTREPKRLNTYDFKIKLVEIVQPFDIEVIKLKQRVRIVLEC